MAKHFYPALEKATLHLLTKKGAQHPRAVETFIQDLLTTHNCKSPVK
jgi:hypothetical protein